jgi:hypothetical protein
MFIAEPFGQRHRAAIAMFGTLLGLASAAWLTAPALPFG